MQGMIEWILMIFKRHKLPKASLIRSTFSNFDKQTSFFFCSRSWWSPVVVSQKYFGKILNSFNYHAQRNAGQFLLVSFHFSRVFLEFFSFVFFLFIIVVFWSHSCLCMYPLFTRGQFFVKGEKTGNKTNSNAIFRELDSIMKSDWGQFE